MPATLWALWKGNWMMGFAQECSRSGRKQQVEAAHPPVSQEGIEQIGGKKDKEFLYIPLNGIQGCVCVCSCVQVFFRVRSEGVVNFFSVSFHFIFWGRVLLILEIVD